MAGNVVHAGGKKNRKHNRMINRAGHKVYNATNRCNKNKKRKLAKHLTKQPNDLVAAAAMEKL